MNKTLLLLFFFGFVLVNGSCKKKEYSDTVPAATPVFYFKGTINGNPVNLQAGVNNYYLTTTYATDANGVYDFTGELKDKNCSFNCSNALKISIKDYRQYAVAPTHIDSSLIPGYYSFATPGGTASAFSVLFYDTVYNATSPSYTWTFGDGASSVQHLPTHVYFHPGVYPVSLSAVSANPCSSSLSNEVMIGQVGELVQLNFSGAATGNTINFASTTGGGTGPGTYTFHWDFGDGNTAVTSAPTYTYTYAAAGVYAVSLTRTDAANTVEVCNRNIATQGVSNCYVHFSPSFITPVANPMNLASVTLEWRDAAGTLYTSNNNSQPVKSKFKVMSVENYQNNLSGQATKKIYAQITCTLYNGASSTVVDGAFVFSVAHP